MDWSVLDSENADDSATVTLELKDGPYSRAMWDFGFQALYKVCVDALIVILINGTLVCYMSIFFNSLFCYFRSLLALTPFPPS